MRPETISSPCGLFPQHTNINNKKLRACCTRSPRACRCGFGWRTRSSRARTRTASRHRRPSSTWTVRALPLSPFASKKLSKSASKAAYRFFFSETVIDVDRARPLSRSPRSLSKFCESKFRIRRKPRTNFFIRPCARSVHLLRPERAAQRGGNGGHLRRGHAPGARA